MNSGPDLIIQIKLEMIARLPLKSERDSEETFITLLVPYFASRSS